MAEGRKSFDEEFNPQITDTLNAVVDHMQGKMIDAKSLSVDEAEKLLDNACDNCIKTFQSKMEEIKASAKKVKPDPSSATYYEDNKKYTAYIATVATGFDKSKSLFDTVFDRIRHIVSTVIDCIKLGMNWIWEQLNETFASIRFLLKS